MAARRVVGSEGKHSDQVDEIIDTKRLVGG